MAYEELKSSGITSNTPKNIMLGAGTIHKGFALDYEELTVEPADWSTNYKNYYTKSGSTYTPVSGQSAPTFSSGTYYKKGWNFTESLIGATSGGSKVSITPELMDVEVDGALVPVKGLKFKTGEKASIEVNFVEMTPDLLKTTTIGTLNQNSDYDGYSEVTSKAQIEAGDYIENFAYVGKKTDGTPIIIIFDNCICTSGFSTEGKNKEAGTFAGVFECVADLSPDANKLPWHILYPKVQG